MGLTLGGVARTTRWAAVCTAPAPAALLHSVRFYKKDCILKDSGVFCVYAINESGGVGMRANSTKLLKCIKYFLEPEFCVCFFSLSVVLASKKGCLVYRCRWRPLIYSGFHESRGQGRMLGNVMG